MKRKLKVNDFFCGCGGMGIAFKNAGYEIAGAWDFDKYAVESYRANVGDHVQKADIKELHQADIPQADVWALCPARTVYGLQKEAMNYLSDIWVIWYTWQNMKHLWRKRSHG